MDTEQPGPNPTSWRDVFQGIAVLALLYAGSVYLPLLGAFATPFLPLPVFFYRRKAGKTGGRLIAVGGVAAAAAIEGGTGPNLFFFFELVLLGLTMGELAETPQTLERAALKTSAAVLGAGTAVIVGYAHTAGGDVVGLIRGYIRASLNFTLAMMKAMGGETDGAGPHFERLQSAVDTIGSFLLHTTPGLAMSTTLFLFWTTLLLSRPLFRATGIESATTHPLNRWKAPDRLIWVVIVCGVLLLIPAGFLRVVGANLMMVLFTVYFFGGIAVVSYFFETKRTARFIRLIVYTLVAMHQAALMFVVGVGLFDTWLDFRKRISRKDDDTTNENGG